MASFATKVIRLSLKAVSTVSPEAAGRMAFQIFCRTPSRKPKNGKEKAVLRSATPIIAQSRTVTLSFAGGWVVARHFHHALAQADRGFCSHMDGDRGAIISRQ